MDNPFAGVLFLPVLANGKDEIFTYGSTYLVDLAEDPIKLKMADTGKVVKIPQKKILAIHVG